MVGSREGRGRFVLGDDFAEAAGEGSTDFLEPDTARASSLAIFSPALSLASRRCLAGVKPCAPRACFAEYGRSYN